MRRDRWVLVPVAAMILACSNGLGFGPGSGDADVSILFIGNSLTYTHDVPGLVRALAERDGRSVATATLARANYSLEDHWNRDVASDIRSSRPDIVVMQQGPSSVDANRAHLVSWSGELAEVVREVGGEPAMYMVWPDASRHFAFGAVETSYAQAAAAIEGRLLPAGSSWLEAWALDQDLGLYGPDGFHPSYVGALLAALTIYAGLFDVEPSALPALDDGLPAERMELLRTAVAAGLERWR